MKSEWLSLPSSFLCISILTPVTCFSYLPDTTWTHQPRGHLFPSLCPSFSLSSPLPTVFYPRFSWTCLSLLLCAVGSFSEHLDQINGRSECVDSTDNSSKPSSEPAPHMARQRLESTEKKKISGKVTKSLSASALSLMIPGGRETSTRMILCDLCMCCSPPRPRNPNLECRLRCKTAWSSNGGCQHSPLECLPPELLEGIRGLLPLASFCSGRWDRLLSHKGLLLLFVFFSPPTPPQVKW